tara:strand:- start:43 stop:258 length:216 start_codon:yes stop_codon:yes gene_type:complete
MPKVNRYTRASKYDGKAIYCPKCDASNRVSHFSWSAITCGGCKEMIDKTEWNLKEGGMTTHPKSKNDYWDY